MYSPGSALVVIVVLSLSSLLIIHMSVCSECISDVVYAFTVLSLSLSLPLSPFLSLSSFLSLSPSLPCHLTVGTRDHSPLSQDPLPTSRHTDRFTRRRSHNREALKGQAKANHRRICREARTRIEGSKVRRMLSSDTKGIEKCL